MGRFFSRHHPLGGGEYMRNHTGDRVNTKNHPEWGQGGMERKKTLSAQIQGPCQWQAQAANLRGSLGEITKRRDTPVSVEINLLESTWQVFKGANCLYELFGRCLQGNESCIIESFAKNTINIWSCGKNSMTSCFTMDHLARLYQSLSCMVQYV